MDQLISHGLASHVFVTDPKQAIAVVESPLVLCSFAELKHETFADIFSKCVHAFQKSNFWHIFLKQAEKVAPGSPEAIQRTRHWLQHIEQGNALPFTGVLLAPLFVVSNGIGDRCLRTLKRLKVRGTQVFAVDVSAEARPAEFMIEFEKALSGSELARERTFRLVSPEPAVIVVAGLQETVLSSERPAAEILSQRKGLAGTSEDVDAAAIL